MASMFSRFHRRGPSNPSSPVPDQQSTWESAPIHEHPQSANNVSPRPEIRSRSSMSQMPPLLPPIARVSSAENEPFLTSPEDLRPVSQCSRSSPARPSQNGGVSGFLGGVALRQSMQQIVSAGPGSAENAGNSASYGSNALPESHLARAKPPPPPINTNFARPAAVPVVQKQKSSSFVTPTDTRHNFNAGATGKRPSGARIVSEPAMLAAVPHVQEVHRAKKGLAPFLKKNPIPSISMLRRRNGQNVPDNMMLPLPEEPVVDPRIRGTRVHDFSAPRPRRVVPSAEAVGSTPGLGKESVSELERSQIISPQSDISVSSQPPLPSLPSQSSQRSDGSRETALDHTRSTSDSSTISKSSIQPAPRQLSRDKPLPDYPGDRTQPAAYPVPPVPPVPPKDNIAVPLRSFPSTTSRAMSVDTIALLRTDSAKTAWTASLKTAASRKDSVLSRSSTRASIMSSLPKHMKSTSSRFSFDMIGAAKQEKLLEERHRQREAEKQIAAPANVGQRDSRFDDFNEDDFDYDAMMEDDGFEEAIPGVNVDLVEDDGFEEAIPGVNVDLVEDKIYEDGDYDVDDDPDNDQENFAGFVFQRSNPASGSTSALTSPHMPGILVTPRDASGNAIGFALTKDTTADLGPVPSPVNLTIPITKEKIAETVTGLGIQGLDANPTQVYNVTSFQENQHLPPIDELRPKGKGDDLYFDGGLADELDFENDGEAFDESLFDLDDTDQYGRPLPGVFAEAKKKFAAKQEEASRRASDLTSSRKSSQSQASQSTAHTSVSIGLPPAIPEKLSGDDASPEQDVSSEVVPASNPLPPLDGKELAYQAALAAAAQKAEASGKFRRSSSPPLPAGVMITSPTDSAESVPGLHPDPDRLEDYEDDPFSHNLDDYELDDDDVIAEANASALANDCDGWYGQEFGFYAAPASQTQGHSHHSSTSSTASSKPLTLNAENLFQYASGGYFGPSGGGLSHSSSGRLVSREPNLTPITERSEYSNRNSIMSMALPPALGSAGGPGSEGRNSGILQSPGLAELAMMEALSPFNPDGSDLATLMKLRSRQWGGSQASLPSSRDGSPRSEHGASSPWGAGSGFFGQAVSGHTRKGSQFSIWSNSDAGGSGAGSPTLTLGGPLPVSSSPAPVPVPPVPASHAILGAGGVMAPPMFSPPPIPNASPILPVNHSSCSPVPEDDEITLEDSEEHDGTATTTTSTSAITSAVTELSDMSLSGYAPLDLTKSPVEVMTSSTPPSPQRQKRPGHRHQGSSDSVSYMMEEGEGETRWVMERRRTAESGEVEILGREVVEGGRI